MKKCNSCGHNNAAGSKFCSECGTKLSSSCPACGFIYEENAKFCSQCGENLVKEASIPSKKEKSLEEILFGEKSMNQADSSSKKDSIQVVTIMFVDVKGFTALSEKLNPEQVKFIMDNILKQLTECIESENGIIDKYIGDAIMALFGLPQPGADDAFRAIKASFKMQRKIDEISKILVKNTGLEIQIRIGINSGKVVVGSVGKGREKDATVLGDPVNLAQRIESNCRPGSILVSDNTRRLTITDFMFKKMPTFRAKGKSKPIQTYEVLDYANFNDFARPPEFNGRLVSFQGRDKEIKYLKTSFEKCLTKSKSQKVLIIGDSGIGKSALAFEFREYLDELKDNIYFFSSRPNYNTTDLGFSFLETALRNRLDIPEGENKIVSKRRLKENLLKIFSKERDNQPNEDELLAFLNEAEYYFSILLDLDDDESQKRDQNVRDQIFNCFVKLIEILEKDGPVFILIDNAHLMHPKSFENIDELFLRLTDKKLFIVLLSKPSLDEKVLKEFNQKANHSVLDLQPLDSETMDLLLQSLIFPIKFETRLPRFEIVEKANGNPYFLFETCHLLLDQGLITEDPDGYCYSGSADKAIAIPNSVYLIIQSRIHNLSQRARELLERASVMGFAFWQRILLEPGFEKNLLSELVSKEMIVPRNNSQIPFDKEYSFSNRLVREICYENVPETERKKIHREMVDWLESFSAQHSLDLSIVLANHKRAAGMIRESYDALLLAADKAYYKADFNAAYRLYEQVDNIRLVNEIFQAFENKDLRLANFRERFNYLTKYIESIKYSSGDHDKLYEVCMRYIKILEESARRPEDTNQNFIKQKPEFLRLLWFQIISTRSSLVDAKAHEKVKKLLGDTKKPQLEENQIMLWFTLITNYCFGMSFTRTYEDEILGVVKNFEDHIRGLKSENAQSLFFLFNGISKYQLLIEQDYDNALKNSAKAAQVAVKELDQKNKLIGLTFFAFCLVEAGNLSLAAQIFHYELELQQKLGTRFELYVYLSNEAECYLRLGHLKTSEKLFAEAIKLLKLKGISASNQADPFCHYALIKLSQGKDKKVDELLDFVKEWAEKGKVYHHRWLRAKAFSCFINNGDIEQAEEYIQKAKELLDNKIETLMTELVLLQILHSTKSPRYKGEEERVRLFVENNRVMLGLIWQNFKSTNTILPPAKKSSEDIRLNALSTDELDSILAAY